MNASTRKHMRALAEAAEEPTSGDRTKLDEAGAIGLLLQRAMPNLSRADLLALLDESHDAERIAERAATVANGVACLVMADADASGLHAGNFQDGPEVAELVLYFADTFKLLAGLARIGAEASASLEEKGGAA